MLGMNDIRKGKIITHEGEPHLVLSAEFSRKQQRRPVMRTQLRNIKTNAVREHTFQQSDQVPEADIARRAAQFLYQQGEQAVFMDQATYEQFEVGSDVTGEAAQFLIEGQEVEIMTFADEPVSIQLPIKVERTVIEAPPGVRGDTSTNVMKEVIVQGGSTVKAPLFVKEGDVIRLDTRDGSYVERV